MGLVETAREASLVRMDSGTLLPGTDRKVAVRKALARLKDNQSRLDLGSCRQAH